MTRQLATPRNTDRARDAPKAVCPNTLYVAATRASERLYVVGEQEEGGKLPFLRLDPAAFEKWGVPLPPWLEVRRCGKLKPPTDAIPVPASSFAVTDLVKFLPEQTMRDATEAVEPVAVEPPTVDAEMDQSVPSLAGAGLPVRKASTAFERVRKHSTSNAETALVGNETLYRLSLLREQVFTASSLALLLSAAIESSTTTSPCSPSFAPTGVRRDRRVFGLDSGEQR